MLDRQPGGGLDFIPEFTPQGTGFVWYLQWGLFGLDDPAVSHTTASIAPSLEIELCCIGYISRMPNILSYTNAVIL